MILAGKMKTVVEYKDTIWHSHTTGPQNTFLFHYGSQFALKKNYFHYFLR